MTNASDFTGCYRPAKFFIIDFVLTWGPLWIAVAGVHSGLLEFNIPFMIVAGISAIPAALYMFYTSGNRALIRDFGLRVIRFNLIPFRWWVILLASIPLIMGSAVLISLPFGGSLEQLAPSDRMASAPLVLALLVLVFGPLPEELGWHGYGVDSLRSRMNGFWTSIVFGIIWPVWHIPLFFIPDSYQQQLLAMPIPLFFYLFGMIPQAVIMNWIYWHTNRSIISAILFHFMINFMGEAFQITQQSKSIAGLLFFTIAMIILLTDRETFWKRPYAFNLHK